jgi:2-hydroxy-6-oxonona-2,4-dienedioate hydrolase
MHDALPPSKTSCMMYEAAKPPGGRTVLQYPVNARGLTTRVIEEGDGPAVVCLHGAGSRADRFRPFLDRLAASGWRGIALDFPGHGWAEAPSPLRYSSPELAEFVLDVLGQLGVDRCAAVGTSLGGHVVAHAAIRCPALFEAAALVGATGIVEYPRDPTRTSSKITGTDEAGTRAKLEFLVDDPALVTDGWVREESRINSAPGRPAAMAALFDYLANGLPADLCGDQYAQLGLPTALVWGEHDNWVPLAVGKRCSELLPDAPFYVVEKTGHAPYFERPDDVAAVLSQFFRAPKSAAAGEQRI